MPNALPQLFIINNAYFMNKLMKEQVTNFSIIQSIIIQLKMSKILGQSQLTKSLAEQTGNAKLHLTSAQNFTKQTQIAFNSFSRDLEKITADLTVLRQKVRKNPTQIKKFFHDKFTPVEDTLVMAEQGQRQQNKINQENMTEIKRENRQTSQSMLRTFQKLKIMEVRVGQYE